MLSAATVQELRQILTEDYGCDVTIPQAAEAATALVGYFALLASLDRSSNDYESTAIHSVPA